jgi:predicted Zn-dependent peptidase
MTSAMLDEGAGSRTALALADEIEFLGATLTASNSFDASAVRLNVPVARIAQGLGVMADVALRPTFPETDFERVRRERLTALLQARDDAESIAPLAFQRAVFGATHRYGTSAAGTESTVATLTRADLQEFHRRWYQPVNSRFVVVGDVQADQVVAQLEKAFTGWTAGPTNAPRTPVPMAPQLTGRQIYIVDQPEAAQSQIRIGNVGVPRATQDFFALEVLNTVLGGSFTSRLNQNLREEHQYTYGAASRFDMRLSAGPFVAAAGVQTDKTAEALREFFKELDQIVTPVPDDELMRAKSYLALSLPADFETARDLSVRLEELLIYNLPDQYFSQYITNVQRVTGADVLAAARARIQTSRMAIVVVGDRKTIEPSIRALNLAPVRIMSVDEALGLQPATRN